MLQFSGVIPRHASIGCFAITNRLATRDNRAIAPLDHSVSSSQL